MMNRVLAVVLHEMRKAIPPFVFLFIMLGVGHITTALVLDEYHVTANRMAVALVGALIVAKAILVADALPFSRIFARRALLWSILWKGLIYTVITLVFRFLEEFIPLARRSGGIATGWDRLLEQVSWPHFWAVQIWIAFSLLGYCLGAEMVRVVGRERVMAVLFGTRMRSG